LAVAIIESNFENEAELETWVFNNLQTFLGDCIPLEKFLLATSSGKGGVPDGFAFNFAAGEWYIVECELLKHGVWTHIAEQISRLVVALQNPDTLRTIRDRLFEAILNAGKTQEVAKKMETSIERLLQEIELFVEGVQPSVVIFIDETNQDLIDFAHSLAIAVQVYRVKKFLVNGQAEYYSPDQQAPVVTTTPVVTATAGVQDYDVVEALGGGTLLSGQHGFTCYKLADNRVIHIKRSKFHEKQKYYWYGVNPSTLSQAHELGVTHIVLVLGQWGFATVPLGTVEEFCTCAKASLNADGSVRHYHVLISPEPEPEMYWSNDVPRYDLSDFSQPFK
jgi:hypothetical protein